MIFEQRLKGSEGMNGKLVLSRRLSLIKDPVAVIMTYLQRAGMQRTRDEIAKNRQLMGVVTGWLNR